MPTDVIIIPVHNRRETTLRCLRALAADEVFSWATVMVVDDGSSDGTADAVTREFPAVAQLRGDGSWWWGGAIRRGMAWALTAGAERVFWLNDDCEPPPGGLRGLRTFATRKNAVAWIDAVAPGGWSYGAYRKGMWSVRRCTASEEARGDIDTFSGNCVCLPRPWIERVGLPDDHRFPHGLADLDYGLRLRAAGAPLRPAPEKPARNADPAAASAESWRTSRRPMRAIWRDFSSPRSHLYFPAWRAFALRHWGPLWGWAVFAAPYVRWLGVAVLRAFNSPSDRETNPR